MLHSDMAMFRKLRGWSGVLFAGLLAFAILIPTLDTFMCIADVQHPQSVTAQLDQPAMDLPAQPKQTHDDGDASCIHGHCHHWVGVAKFGERLALEAKLTYGELPRGLYNSPPSAPQLELLRPPRA
jgi:hypothetical protein